MSRGARSGGLPYFGFPIPMRARPGSPPVSRLEVGQGAFAVSRDPGLLMTATLGSCVGVVLHDPVGRIGGMTHIFQCVDPGLAGDGAVVAEIEKLVNALMRDGAPRAALEASVIGGARTLGRGRDVGGEIALVCLKFLDAERILLRTSDLRGTRPRRITFRPACGTVQIAYPGHDLPPVRLQTNRSQAGKPELF